MTIHTSAGTCYCFLAKVLCIKSGVKRIPFHTDLILRVFWVWKIESSYTSELKKNLSMFKRNWSSKFCPKRCYFFHVRLLSSNITVFLCILSCKYLKANIFLTNCLLLLMVRVHEQFVKICLKIRSNKNNYDARWRYLKLQNKTLLLFIFL